MRGFVFSGVLKAQAFINEGKYKMTRQRLVWFFNCNIEPKGKPQVILPIGRQACHDHFTQKTTFLGAWFLVLCQFFSM